MPDSGETPVKKTIGTVISQEQLETLMVTHNARPEPFCKLTTGGGAKYTFAYLERCGIAMFSHQDGRVWVLELAEMALLARDAGIDAPQSLIIVPGREVPRG